MTATAATTTSSAQQSRNGPICRKDDTTTLTNYLAFALYGQQEIQLYKRVSGSHTQLGANAAITVALPDEVRVEADGSTIKASYAGVEEITETDTAITGNLRCGFFSNNAGSQSTAARLNDFAAADLAVAAAATRRRVGVAGSGRAMMM